MMTKKQSLKIQELYIRYEYLADVYANKVFNYHLLGMEKDDIVQEFKAKVWTSVIAFIKKWKQYRDTGEFKPSPLPYYIKANLSNLKIDLIKKINNYGQNSDGEFDSGLKGFMSIENTNFDIGVENNLDTVLDFEKKVLCLRGVNLLEGLDDIESRIFCMFVRGHTKKNLKKVFKTNVSPMINRQIESIRQQVDIVGESYQPYIVYENENQ